VRVFVALAAIIIAAGCRRSENADRRGDTAVTPPVSIDTTRRLIDSLPQGRNCGVTGIPVIENDGIGELKVGRKVSDIRNLCDVKSDSEEPGTEGMKERILVTSFGGIAVQALVSNDRVTRISVTSPPVRTRDSLGVDTPLRMIADMRGARFVAGEDGVYAFVADHCGLSFRFSIPLRPPTGSDWTADAAKREHGEASVDRILITSCAR
jgi:hypothetical protein